MEVRLALEALADPVPAGGLYFSGTRAALAIAFPRYRVFVYNTTDRNASVNVFAYPMNERAVRWELVAVSVCASRAQRPLTCSQ